MKHKQSGFSAIVLLFVVLVVVGVSTAAWYVWRATQKDDSAGGPQSTSKDGTASPSQDKPVAYLMIPEQHVRLPLNDELSGIRAGKFGVSPLHASDQSVPIVAPELDDDWTCEAAKDGTKGTLGYISITSQLKRAGPGDPAASKRIGDYTYGFEPGGSGCTKSSKHQELTDAFKKRFQLLEAY